MASVDGKASRNILGKLYRETDATRGGRTVRQKTTCDRCGCGCCEGTRPTSFTITVSGVTNCDCSTAIASVSGDVNGTYDVPYASFNGGLGSKTGQCTYNYTIPGLTYTLCAAPFTVYNVKLTLRMVNSGSGTVVEMLDTTSGAIRSIAVTFSTGRLCTDRSASGSTSHTICGSESFHENVGTGGTISVTPNF